jgi:hypothetical protein
LPLLCVGSRNCLSARTGTRGGGSYREAACLPRADCAVVVWGGVGERGVNTPRSPGSMPKSADTRPDGCAFGSRHGRSRARVPCFRGPERLNLRVSLDGPRKHAALGTSTCFRGLAVRERGSCPPSRESMAHSLILPCLLRETYWRVLAAFRHPVPIKMLQTFVTTSVSPEKEGRDPQFRERDTRYDPVTKPCPASDYNVSLLETLRAEQSKGRSGSSLWYG